MHQEFAEEVVSELAPLETNGKTNTGSTVAQVAPINVRTSASCAFVNDLPECAICLETSSPSVKVVLSCGHTFCYSCISSYVHKESEDNKVASCPTCKRELLRHELLVCLSDQEVDQLIVDAAARVPQSDCQRGSQVAHISDDLRIAGFDAAVAVQLQGSCSNLKLCPSCNAPIEKNGGCDHMTCRCGHHFRWSEVPSVVPCDCVNPHPTLGIWGKTCPNCTWKASAKLTARRVGIVTGGAVAAVVATPVVLIGGVVFLVVAGAHSVAKKAQSCVADSKNIQVEKAERRVRQAESRLADAEGELQREEQKWFNHAAIDAARKSVVATRALLQTQRESLQDIVGGEIDTAEVGQPRGFFCCG